MTAVASLSELHFLLTFSMEWKLTPASTVWVCCTKDIDNNRKSRGHWFVLWLSRWEEERKSDRRTSGWWGGRRDLLKSVVSLLIQAWRTRREGRVSNMTRSGCERSGMFFFFLFCKEIGSRGRKEGRNSALVMSALHFFSAWLVGTSQWLLGCIWCREVWGQSCSEWTAQRGSHTELYSNLFPRSTCVSALGPRTVLEIGKQVKLFKLNLGVNCHS